MPHSVIPPSGDWPSCAMWAHMNSVYPKAPTPDTMSGDAAHWAWQEILRDRVISEGQIAPNGVVLTSEMIEGAELFADTVRAQMGDAPYRMETPVAIPSVHAQCWGTPDVHSIWAWRLRVIDYKFGHRFVDEYENDQCTMYAAGVIDGLAETMGVAAGALDQRITVDITIVQPRCYYKGAPVRTWSIPATDLRARINQLHYAADAALSPNPVATTNEGCVDCPGKHACPALQRAAYSDAEFSSQSTPGPLPVAAASLELRYMERARDRLNARIEGLSEELKAKARSGQRLPFQHLESGWGRTVWDRPVAEVIAMGELFGVDLGKQDVITPKQAIAKGIDETVISSYSRTPPGKTTLVQDDPADIRRVFGVT